MLARLRTCLAARNSAILGKLAVTVGLSVCTNVWSSAFRSLLFSFSSFFASSSPSIQTGLIDGLICGTNANRGSRTVCSAAAPKRRRRGGRSRTSGNTGSEKRIRSRLVGPPNSFESIRSVPSQPGRTSIPRERKSLDAARNEKVSRSSSSAAAFPDD